jgi:hypothetical protein
MLRALALAGAVTAAALLSPVHAVAAAPAAPVACQSGAFYQFDLAGVYLSPEHRMRLEMYPCGGSYLQWDNAYGTHYAAYASTIRLTGGGVGAVPMAESPSRLDGVGTVGFKPGTPGNLEVITVNAYGEVVGIYRLRKV